MRVAITGANRGIGLEFTRQYAQRGDQVEAGVRHPEQASALHALQSRFPERIRVHRCDVGSDESAHDFARGLSDAPLDLLVNNAGVYGEWESLERLSIPELLHTFQVNAVGALRVTRALLPALRRGEGRRLAHVTSQMGSIGDNRSGGAYGYRMSKAALNMLARSMAVDLAREGFVTVVLSPGWVQTDMGGPRAPTPVDESVGGMIRLLDGLQPSDNGRFLDFQGRELPW